MQIHDQGVIRNLIVLINSIKSKVLKLQTSKSGFKSFYIGKTGMNPENKSEEYDSKYDEMSVWHHRDENYIEEIESALHFSFLNDPDYSDLYDNERGGSGGQMRKRDKNGYFHIYMVASYD